MLAELHMLAADYPFELKQVEIDGNSALEQRYGEFIPVLIAEDSGQEICHYHLDRQRFIASLDTDLPP